MSIIDTINEEEKVNNNNLILTGNYGKYETLSMIN